MPPRAKFTKEQIISAALGIVRDMGHSELTARVLGRRLGSSACPIFTVFESMDEVREETVKAARAVYAEYIERGLKETPAFKGVGKQYILFAVREPKLFRLLFMSENKTVPSVRNVLPVIDDNYAAILKSVQVGYGLDAQTAEKVYKHLWIYSHGIATLCATNMCTFSPEEIGNMLTEVFKGIMSEFGEGGGNDSGK